MNWGSSWRCCLLDVAQKYKMMQPVWHHFAKLGLLLALNRTITEWVHAVQCWLATARDECAIWKRTYELLWTSFGSLRWKTLTRNGFGTRSFTRSEQIWHPIYCSWSPQAAAITGPTPLLGMILSTSSKPRAGLQLVSCAWPGRFMSVVFFKRKGLMVMPNLWWIWLALNKGCGDASKILLLPSSFSWHYSNTHGAGMSGDCGWSKMAWEKS